MVCTLVRATLGLRELSSARRAGRSDAGEPLVRTVMVRLFSELCRPLK
jgi:hypothetical protein